MQQFPHIKFGNITHMIPSPQAIISPAIMYYMIGFVTWPPFPVPKWPSGKANHENMLAINYFNHSYCLEDL